MRTPNNESLTPTTERTRPGGKSPERKCILTGRHGERDELIRLAISPDGDVLPDPRARAPGRGAWLGVSRAELETAIAKGKLKGALARAFKSAPPRVPDDLPAQIDAGLLRTLTDRLGLEMRSGHLILGSERIAEHARGGVLAALYHAADASDGGAAKLDQAWRVGSDREGSGEGGTRLPLDRAALSVALGRDNVVHLALADHAAAERVDQALTRLLQYRNASADVSEAGAA
ncbi:MAG: transcription terminating nucleic-acid-binding protein [Erythrobacteraceae bacterium]|nr:transcription terminating nucleic-acid-binding protein [Citromicrobium sp.]MAL00179.1 transcription terminating nucleic-acid-binding protein [Citromicrobium sp.]MAS85872.1 transcription terminating nucleic-acid-binding protein [Erythrobacteraceae bacterium]MBT45933.1 transcription terminating nucleic-acid-binding protein [Citromicrobium sp.]|tara:strand:+ start:575 stop:1270 length:696 start_codon:yes stop_codon:yes gene_type:complete